MTINLAGTKIVKKLRPTQAGAKKLADRFGSALVCVRYRQDIEHGRRFTTVELLVDEGPMRSAQQQTVHVKIGLLETELRKAACAQGARWDPDRQAWQLTKKAAKQLDMLNRIVPTYHP